MTEYLRERFLLQDKPKSILVLLLYRAVEHSVRTTKLQGCGFLSRFILLHGAKIIRRSSSDRLLEFEALHAARVLVQQVPQIGRRNLRVSDCRERGTAIMPELTPIPIPIKVDYGA